MYVYNDMRKTFNDNCREKLGGFPHGINFNID